MIEAQKIGRYEVIEEKGHGAMGSVYIARDPAMDRVVALKTIHSIALTGPQAEEFRQRFYREARSAGGLAHPGIVTVFDVGEQDGVPYLVMEYVEGRTLAEAAQLGERFTLERVCEIGQQIAEALGYAHKNGVIHRDIKPANILMTSIEKYGIERPKITDFGVAKLGAAELTTTGQMLGTPAFMPPEQFTGAPIDGRSDLFSLGVILYWMATGEYAFPGETVTAVSYKVVHTEPIPPRKLNPAVPTAFDQIIMRCLAKAPSDRYPTGDDLARDLIAIRSGQGSAVLQTAVPTSLPGSASSGMDVTLDSHPGGALDVHGIQQSDIAVKPSASARRAGAAEDAHGSKPHKPQHRVAATIAIIVLVILVAGGWYGYTHREQLAALAGVDPAEQPVTEPDTPDSNEITPPKAARNSESANREPRKDSSNTPTTRTGTKPDSVRVPLLAALPAPPRVDFDPKTLDPNANGKLKIDAGHFPENVAFTVEMGGKIYFERGGNNNQNVFDDLYVPPGIPEFRVIAGVGANRKTSNIVSAEFKAKKKKTLHIELRTQGQKDSSIPSGVYTDSQIVVTLK
jgi:serine/threonine-protein kinase